MELQNRHVVISGVSRGIGAAWARALAEAGSRVTGGCRNPEGVPEDLRHEDIRLLPLDVTSDTSVRAFADALAGEPVDWLIHNAGVFGPREQRIEQADADAYARILDANVLGPIRLTRELRPHLQQAGHPVIVNVTSGMGSIQSNRSGGMMAYRMSKAALNMVTRTLALDEPEWTVVCVHPGWVRTDMGGEDADLSVEECIGHLMHLLHQLQPDASGCFLNYDGAPIPW